MSKKFTVSILLVSAMVMYGCPDKSADKPAGKGAEKAAAPAADISSVLYDGKVLSTMNVGNYTYVEIEQGGKKAWAAGPITEVKAGDQVVLGEGAIMTDFHSKGLDRTFQSILFTGEIKVEGAVPAGSTPSAASTATPAAPHGDASAPAKGSIAKPKSGYSVEEIYAKKKDLSGKTIEVRGKVMKANPNIMGTNWYHIQDGTGTGPTADLMVTSAGTAAVGNIVIAKGKVTLDKDFGAGYKYAVIMDGAELKAE